MEGVFVYDAGWWFRQIVSVMSRSGLSRLIRKCVGSAARLGAAVLCAQLLVGSPVVRSAESPPEFSPDKVEFYEKQVKPLLVASCLKCHGATDKIKGGLRLTGRQAMLEGGDTGPAASLEHPEKSLILKAISYTDDDLQMPPKDRLTKDKVEVLTKWVAMGLPWTPGEEPAMVEARPKRMAPKVTPETMKFWSFVPVKRPEVPYVKDLAWVKTPIDAFVLAKLDAAGLKPAPPAEKVALLRRVYYDLTGLPPTPAEVDAFVADQSANAYEAVVDRLLASPRYGEKWARHWLDVVRYAETNSFERDGAKPNAWRYRDYVIDSFNSDKPYDQFVREQIAGDELDQVTSQSITATGYYRLGNWDDEPSDRLQARYDDLDDIVATTGQAFLGLTMNCARCHDHKLDPIPQKDYYKLLAFFQGIKPYNNDPKIILRDIVPDQLPKAKQDELLDVNRRKEELKKLVHETEERALGLMTDVERKAARKNDKAMRDQLLETIGKVEFARYAALRDELKTLETRAPEQLPQALCVRENGASVEPTFIMLRGNAHVQGEQVEPGFPLVLAPPAAVIPKPDPKATSSGRRRVLAEYLASEKNPLVARVMVNRIWQHHFGRGIVRSPNDFGSIGERPTHPELLDWLASEFIKRGWRMKDMHKLIMMSNAYQMSSAGNATALAKDSQNDLFWRFDMRRLEAEEIRDSVLFVNGKLNLKMGGPSVFPTIPEAVLAGQSQPGNGWGKSTPEEQARRSIYVHVKRSLIVPTLASLDSADTDFTCPVRFVTTQSTQALTMLNSQFSTEESKAFAKRLRNEAGEQPAKQVHLALRLALCREPSAEQVGRGVKYMDRLKDEYHVPTDVALDQFCLLVLNLNEFVYLD